MLQEGMQEIAWGDTRLVDVDMAPGPLEVNVSPLFEGSRLLLNARASNGGGIREALLPAPAQSGAEERAAGERTLESCVPVGGDVFSAAVEWQATGRDVAQLAVR